MLHLSLYCKQNFRSYFFMHFRLLSISVERFLDIFGLHNVLLQIQFYYFLQNVYFKKLQGIRYNLFLFLRNVTFLLNRNVIKIYNENTHELCIYLGHSFSLYQLKNQTYA